MVSPTSRFSGWRGLETYYLINLEKNCHLTMLCLLVFLRSNQSHKLIAISCTVDIDGKETFTYLSFTEPELAMRHGISSNALQPFFLRTTRGTARRLLRMDAPHRGNRGVKCGSEGVEAKIYNTERIENSMISRYLRF